MSDAVEWRDIPSFPGYPGYEMNLTGEVRILFEGTVFVVHPYNHDRKGKCVNLWRDGEYTTQVVMDLIAETFPDKFKTLDELFEEAQEKLTKAFVEEYTKIVVDYYGQKDEVATALVKRLVKEGWHPDGQC